jgi:predicted O-methyltransferase YrrM
MSFDDRKLNLDFSWRIGEAAFLTIVEKITELLNKKNANQSCIVEFGSGASSIRLALNFPNTKIIAIDGDREWYQETENLALEFLQSSEFFELKYQPLSFREYGSGKILSYTQDLTSEAKFPIDCVIIDGPPFYTLRGREACLYQVYEQLNIGGLVILDDFNREAEQTILKNWLSVYPDSFAVEILEVGHHLAVLEKKQSVSPNWTGSAKAKDSLEINDKYQKILAALHNLENADIANLLNCLPSDIVIPSLKNRDNLDNFLTMMSAIQNTYKQVSVELSVDNIQESTLTPQDLLQLQIDSFCSCLQLFNLSQPALI